MKFKDFKEKNSSNYDFFEADEMSYKEFVQLSFKEFLAKYNGSKWRINIDDKRFNSFPNFTQKHQICISNLDFYNVESADYGLTSYPASSCAVGGNF